MTAERDPMTLNESSVPALGPFSCRLTLCCAAPSGLLGEKPARSWQSEWPNTSPR